jgi:hypothetical protein
LAKKILDVQGAPIPVDGELEQTSPSFPTIRWGQVQHSVVVEACLQAVDELTVILEASGIWSSSSLDAAVWDFTERISELPLAQLEVGRRVAITEAVKRFNEQPSAWTVDLLTYGLHENCAGADFGRILFLVEDTNKWPELATCVPGFPMGIRMFARLDTTAVDEQSAIRRAETILDEHLMVLNALCSEGLFHGFRYRVRTICGSLTRPPE